jgi:hypothetical protein
MAIRTNAKTMMETLQVQLEDLQKRKADIAEYQYVISLTQCFATIEVLYQLETLNAKSTNRR